MNQKFCNDLVHICSMTNTVQAVKKVPTAVGSIVVVGVLTCCGLLHFMWDLKVTQVNRQQSLIQELMLYKFELGHNTTEATKNICCVKGEGIDDHSTVIR